MKNIIVKKILKYDPTVGGKYSKYEGYCLIGMKIVDPGILLGQKQIEANVKAFRSPRKRAEESIKCSEVLMYLDEVKFDMTRLLREEEYNQYGSNLVRERFARAFVEDTLEEKREKIRIRVEDLLKSIKEDCLLVSHSFFMKILEGYCRDASLFNKPELLFNFLKPDQKTYNFGEGFEIRI